jgi:D-serine deaminase-like pyridoxal phosphate-dependent protein
MVEDLEASDLRIDLRIYELQGAERIMTPALLIYRDLVEANIATTLRLLNGQAQRWRPHVKTAKLGYVMRMLSGAGVTSCKCATSLELLTAIHSGAKDVLVAYPLMGANARRIREIAQQYPEIAVSVLIENVSQVEGWRGSRVGIFVDINPGMNRTGIEQTRAAEIVNLARKIVYSGLEFRGLHYYDGHLTSADMDERKRQAHSGYDRLLSIAESIELHGMPVKEIIAAGTPALPCALSYPGFQKQKFLCSVSPGTVVYCDAASLRHLPREFGYVPAVLVLSQVVSRPADEVITCDAGHKTMAIDMGVPNCVVAGWERLELLRPSEEHLPIHVPKDVPCPEVGDFLYLVPQHVCPTVNNFNQAVIVANGKIAGVENVDARGREGPLRSPLGERDAKSF